MWILTLISILATVIYVGYVINRVGELPASISSCVYEFPESISQICWTGFIWIAGICGMVPLIARLGEFGIVGFVTLVFIVFVGIMPLSEKETRYWHYWLSVAAGVLSQVCVALACPYWLFVWTIWLPFMAGTMAALNDSEEELVLLNGKAALFAELSCAVSIWGCCL